MWEIKITGNVVEIKHLMQNSNRFENFNKKKYHVQIKI